MEQKLCKICNKSKQVSDFSMHTGRQDGLTSQCKTCKSAYDKARYEKNKEKYKENAKEWRDANPERSRELIDRHRKENKNLYNARQRKIRLENPERLASYSKRYREKNPEKVRQFQIDWRHNNRDKARASVRTKQAQRRQAMPSWANKKAIGRIYSQARILELSDGIERHVDHIIPINGRLVCGLHVENNLQILTAKENMCKSNRHTNAKAS